MTDYSARRTVMVDTQIRPSDVTKFPIIDAMMSVPREAFVPRNLREAAYIGENIDLGGGRVVIEPRTLAKMLDALDIQGDELVLDIGCALGYSSAVMARMAEAVVAVEENADMAAEAQGLLAENGADNVVLHEGPLAQGAAEHGPYDVIVLQGAVEHLPDALLDQLKDGGRIACLFMEGALGVVRIGYKIDGDMTWRFAFNAGAPVLPGFERHAAFTL
ncbi:protein-L-isoaspartate(D-aspartate) O-methyltransferase [Roseovarius pacificus]|uniref:Protein-L-isoaspartate O-methyltransferase n=1 Tax=Roseovarius pacificus TaxID=337701 RepID=A0A1M6YP45_9RHOB|nr:protein-L-isoaspartate O-methyltransferase [Roseovarius pacificus]GGO50598.1 protein-L-isoaspartate O-methyltransferase [Roseovarius pacificus]SHL19920.1 protein-L-isoaspartate(D-aspartate) O-methyltransferase [Roseovarius pacificus]